MGKLNPSQLFLGITPDPKELELRMGMTPTPQHTVQGCYCLGTTPGEANIMPHCSQSLAMISYLGHCYQIMGPLMPFPCVLTYPSENKYTILRFFLFVLFCFCIHPCFLIWQVVLEEFHLTFLILKKFFRQGPGANIQTRLISNSQRSAS